MHSANAKYRIGHSRYSHLLTKQRCAGPLCPFLCAGTHPIFAPWRKIPTLQKSPQNRRNPRRQIPRRHGPTCSRSGRRWRNCSIPRSIAARAASAPAPDCSRRRTIPGTAAPAAKPPRIGRATRRAGAGEDVAKTRCCDEVRLPTRDRLFLPSPRARSAWRGGVGGGGSPARSTDSDFAEAPPTPRPLPAASRREGRKGVVPQSEKSPASTNPRSANSRRPITAPPPPFRRSIRNWQSSSASPPRRKTPPRWRGRRATRWRRSASPPPPMRWTR